MIGQIQALLRRGFIGPRYTGILGRLRFFWQEIVVRTDVFLMAEPADVSALAPLPEVNLLEIFSFEEFAPFEGALDEAYGAGYAARWHRIFGWGERLFLLLHDGSLAGFGWVTPGTRRGRQYYLGHIYSNEYRVSRVGVLPAFRRRGFNTAFYVLLLRRLFAEGATRAVIECNKDNFPSLGAIKMAGFRQVGEVLVLGEVFGGFTKWKP